MNLVPSESSKPARHRSRVSRTIAVVATVVALLGCSEAVRDIEGAAAKEVLDERTVLELDALGVEVDGDLDCSVDVNDDNEIVGTCTGSTTDEQPILTTLDGTVENVQCSAEITISVGDEVVYDESEVDCLEENLE